MEQMDLVGNEIAEDLLENPLLRIHALCAYWFGLVWQRNQKLKSLRFGICFFFTFSSIWTWSYMSISALGKGNNLDPYSCAFTLLYISFSITLMNAFFQRERIAKLLNHIHYDLQHLLSRSDAMEDHLYAGTVRYARWATFIVTSPSWFGAATLTLELLLRAIWQPHLIFHSPEVARSMPKVTYLLKSFPFDELFENFFVTFVLVNVALYLIAAGVPLWDTFVMVLMKFLIFKYQIINKRLREMDISKVARDRNGLQMENLDGLSDEEKSRLRLQVCEFCVKEQIKIRWYLDELQILLRVPIFADCLIFSILLCFVLYGLTSSLQTLLDVIVLSLFLFVMSVKLFFSYWHANLITESNDQLGNAAYFCDWYEYPVSLQKSIRLVMMSTSEPLILTALFVPMNLNTFISIMRGAFSYLSLLRTMRDK